jgi:HD superfamily phosphohydrolase
LVEAFTICDGKIEVSYNGLRTLQDFWDLQIRVYKDRIYTENVLAAEAMVTRALEMALLGRGRAQIARFSRADDSEAWLMMSDTPVGSSIVRDLKMRRVYKSLSVVNREAVQKIRMAIESNGGRMAFPFRRSLEGKIARRLGVSAEQVITHFSFTREFKGLCAHGQRILLDSEATAISLEQIPKYFKGTRAPGSRFDVFVPSDTPLQSNSLDVC